MELKPQEHHKHGLRLPASAVLNISIWHVSEGKRVVCRYCRLYEGALLPLRGARMAAIQELNDKFYVDHALLTLYKCRGTIPFCTAAQG